MSMIKNKVGTQQYSGLSGITNNWEGNVVGSQVLIQGWCNCICETVEIVFSVCT